MRGGEIRWYTFAAPDRRRPVLVLSRDSVIAQLDEADRGSCNAHQLATDTLPLARRLVREGELREAAHGLYYAPAASKFDYDLFSWPPSALQDHLKFLTPLNEDLQREGVLVGIEGLTPPNQAKRVQANPKGGPPITDGPFPESKEFLARWWMIDVETSQRAMEIAARASTAPGRDGRPMNMIIEVREVMSGAPAK